MFDIDALVDYTQGRLSADDEETERVLARSLGLVRRWCGWHVAPVLTETVILDGPGGPLLTLPTQKLIALTAVTEDAQALDLTTLVWSRRGLVEKRVQTPLPISFFGAGRYVHRTYLPWNFWTDQLSGISVTMQHGFADAPDLEDAVFSVADRISQTTTGGTPVSVGPFRWGTDNAVTTGSALTGTEMAILDKYRLERAA